MNDRVVPFLVHEYFLSILVLSAGISLTPEVFWSRCTDESPVGTPTFLVERLVKPCFPPTKVVPPIKPFEPRTWQRQPQHEARLNHIPPETRGTAWLHQKVTSRVKQFILKIQGFHQRKSCETCLPLLLDLITSPSTSKPPWGQTLTRWVRILDRDTK